MHRRSLVVLALLTAVMTFSGCQRVDETKAPAAATSSANTAAGKIPVTTVSEPARKEFLQGRDLNEKLLIQDSIQHFDRAIALDPNFA